MAEDVDYMAVASMTDGMVGAELANIVEVAAINMIRDGRTEVLFFLNIELSLVSFFFFGIKVFIIIK
jgi:SpoVK/Ycf46/Vps4 family AAA+-type ATPase